MSFPFRPEERTTCSCAACVQCCKDQPGSLAPGDFERIRDHLGLTDQEARAYFWDSPGSQVMDTKSGRQFWVRTIVPRWHRGKCIFLDDQDRCRIHAVSPAGCAYFDTHMGFEEGYARSVEMVKAHADPAYQELRKTMNVATRYKGRRW